MSQIVLGPNRAYPSIPTVAGDTENHTLVLESMREALSIHERRTANVFDSFVRLQELVDLGIVNIDGQTGIVEAPDDDTDGSSTHNHDSPYIRLDGTSPATTGTVEFGASISVTGGVSVSGEVTAATFSGIASANLLDKSAAETISGPYTYTNSGVGSGAAIVIDASQPGLTFYNSTEVGADEKYWSFGTNTGGTFRFSTTPDAGRS